MVAKRITNTEEIRSYIKLRCNLGRSLKEIFADITQVYGKGKVSYETVCRWKKKFDNGVESVENARRSGRPKSATCDKNVTKIQEILQNDARYTLQDLARISGISRSRIQFILKKILKVRKISARWVPHILTDEQKRRRVETAKMLLKLFPKYTERAFANVVTGDETWVHYFEPVRKVRNKIWASKYGKRPTIAKRSSSAKKVLYAIFFTSKGLAVQIPVNKGRSVTGRYYRDVILKKLKKYYEKRRPLTGLVNVRLLHDNAPAHTSSLVTQYLKPERVTMLPIPPYSPDLAPCDFYLFPKLKNFLSGRKYRSRQALGSAVYQCLRTIPESSYRDAFKKWIHRLKLCISHHGEYFEGMK